MDIGRNDFYVILFSNASLDLYPDNTRAVFTTHLAHPIDLGTSLSEWEVGLCEISYGGPSNELVKANTLVDKTIVFVFLRPRRTTIRGGSKSPNIANNSLSVERRGTPFSKCLLSPRGKKSLSGYQYSDATNGRFNSTFRNRYITRKNGTTISTCGINTRDVSSYRHYPS